MHPTLQQLFFEIEAQRKKTIHTVRDFTHEQLVKSPRPGKWSAAQILSHLVTAEQLSVRYMQKKIQGINDLADSGFWEEIKINAFKVSQRFPGLKFKAPKAVVEHMPEYQDLQAIVSAWDKVREDLKLLLEKIPEDQIKRKVYRHAVAGYLNVRHSLLFFREHIIHHTSQLRKLSKLK